MAPKGSTIPVTHVSEMARLMRNMLTYGAKGSTIPVTQVSEMARLVRNMLTYGAKRVHNTSDTCIRDGQIDEEHAYLWRQKGPQYQ